MSTNLQTLLNAIPVAEDGHVITREYHNSLRNAVRAIAVELEDEIGVDTAMASFAPVFFPVDDDIEKRWRSGMAVATRPEGSAADGWLPVRLLDNARLVSLTVVGRKFVDVPGALSLRVMMRRRSLVELTDSTLININLRNVNGEPFTTTGFLSNPGDENSLVDNSRYQYFIQALMTKAPTDLQIDFYAFQVNCNLI